MCFDFYTGVLGCYPRCMSDVFVIRTNESVDAVDLMDFMEELVDSVRGDLEE